MSTNGGVGQCACTDVCNPPLGQTCSQKQQTNFVCVSWHSAHEMLGPTSFTGLSNMQSHTLPSMPATHPCTRCAAPPRLMPSLPTHKHVRPCTLLRATASEPADGSTPPPKRRGRPRTTQPKDPQDATPKRRGRPKTRDVDAPATPSRRGRKPKTPKPEEAPAAATDTQRSIAAAVADMDAAVRGDAQDATVPSPDAGALTTRQDTAPAPNRDM